MPSISKTAQLLKYFAQHYQRVTGQGIHRTRLMKMAYLSDLLAREYLGEQITAFSYYRYTYGPYDDHIRDFVDELVAVGLGERKLEYGPDHTANRLLDVGGPIVFEFAPTEQEILTYVRKTYLHMDMDELLQEVVYKTKPMVPLPAMDEDLKMDDINNAGRKIVGFDLADVLKAEAELDRGEFVIGIPE